jgi:hypothetical protein
MAVAEVSAALLAEANGGPRMTNLH